MITIASKINEEKWTQLALFKNFSNETSLQQEKQNFESYCQTLLNICVTSLALENLTSELSLVFTNDKEIKILNGLWRNKDKATNVLSFPTKITPFEHDKLRPFLGDIIFAFETIEKEAFEMHRDFQAHFSHLFVHGFLHLLGFDHQDKQQAEQMEQVEINILQKLSIKNPYET